MSLGPLTEIGRDVDGLPQICGKPERYRGLQQSRRSLIQLYLPTVRTGFLIFHGSKTNRQKFGLEKNNRLYI